MKKIVFLIVVFIVLLSCKKVDFAENTVKKDLKFNSPYEAFYENLETGKITDTVLVQNKTQVFGCGTAAYEYFEELKKSGLDKYYVKYNDVLSDTLIVNKFAKKHNTKILWVTRGNEGEKMELLDPIIHKKANLEKRLWATKNFIKFSENPITMDAVTIYYSIAYPIEKKYYAKEYKVSKVNENWKSIKISTEKSEIKDFENAYYPF
ncbi:hypothetical protein [Flavobacterium sp.]|uniref:hypothetical protein n=1 Tax=Flavobacterium sp. TaxID=239 RepID=UPI0037530232